MPAGFPAHLPASMGLIGLVIVVPFQLRLAEWGVAAPDSPKVTLLAPGAKVGRHGADIAGRLGVGGAAKARITGLGMARVREPGAFAVTKPGEPAVHLKHAGVL